MDGKKRLKRSKQSDISTDVHKTPNKVSKSSEAIVSDISDAGGSPDFLSSQECFTVGWDWSGQIQGNRKPTIRVVERPVPRRNEGVELLKCSRPRRVIRNYDSDLFDASSFVEELKSLAADFKRVPESSSPVASPPHSSFRRRRDIIVTPTSSKGDFQGPSTSTSVESSEPAVSSVSVSPIPLEKTQDKVESRNDSLNGLLDDSLGADLLKFTQDLEQDVKHSESKTPRPQERGLNHLSNSKRKSRLSLSSKKDDNNLQNSVCRRINDVYEEIVVSHSSKLQGSHNDVSVRGGKRQDKQNNNEFDDLDEAALLTLCELEEQEITKSREALPAKQNSCNLACSNGKTTNDIKSSLEEDDDFVSPDLLDMIDIWEKKATLICPEATAKKEPLKALPTTSKEQASTRTLDLLDKSDKQHERSLERPNKENGSRNVTGPLPPLKKTLSLSSGNLRCTPEEIEMKRQDAIRKRLQLKKKSS